MKNTSGINLRTPPPPPSFWTKAVSIERKTSKIRLCTKKNTLTSEKVKIIEVLCMKENNNSASFLLFNKAMPSPVVNSF